MTAQISDRFIYRGEEHQLCARQGGDLTHPSQFGMTPIKIHTACYRGFYCTYKIERGGLFLSQMTLREARNNYLPIQEQPPTLKRYQDIITEATYKDLSVPVAFTGRIIVGMHMVGSSSWIIKYPTSFLSVYNIGFREGELISEIDLSDEVAALREEMRQQQRMEHSDEGLQRWIERALALRLEP